MKRHAILPLGHTSSSFEIHFSNAVGNLSLLLHFTSHSSVAVPTGERLHHLAEVLESGDHNKRGEILARVLFLEAAANGPYFLTYYKGH